MAKWIAGLAVGSMVAVAVAPVSWTVPIVLVGIGGMIGARRMPLC